MNKLGVHAFVWEHGWSREQPTRAINRTATIRRRRTFIVVISRHLSFSFDGALIGGHR